MSASNWRICPKCEKEWVDPTIEVKKMYGTIPLEEYEEAMRDAKNSPPLKKTLREDYEFYLRGFILHIYYGCSCEECGFKFDLNKEINIEEGAA